MSKIISRPGPRFLYPELVASRSLSRCGIVANALWPRLIVQADDQGRMAGDVASILVSCFPKMLDQVTYADVDRALDELKKAGMVIVYRANHEVFVQLAEWWRWQQGMRRAYPSRFPAPRGWVDVEYGGTDDPAQTFAKALELGRFVLRKRYQPGLPAVRRGAPSPPAEVPYPRRGAAARGGTGDSAASRVSARAQGHDPTLPDPSVPDPTRSDPSTARDVPPRRGTNGAKPRDQSIDDSIAMANDETKSDAVRRAARRAVETHAPERLGEIGAGA